MKVSIFGLGYVGAVTAACLARRCNDVIGVEPDEHKRELIARGRSPVVESGLDEIISAMTASGKMRVTDDYVRAVCETDLSMVCVGTPCGLDGRVDATYVTRVCEQIGRAIAIKGRFHSVVIRSTVLPGTTSRVLRPILEQHSGGEAGSAFGLSMNPEFLREGSAVADFADPPFTIIGAESEEEFAHVAQLWSFLPDRPIRCRIEEAEAIKFVCNMFHAVKITFANEVGQLCHSLGVNARHVMNMVCRDTKLNLSPRYLQPGFAFGGSCLGKDLRALTTAVRERGAALPMIESALISNQKQVDGVARRIMARCNGHRTITQLGLSFKDGTDDLRESPLVALAETLIGRGYDLRIYDPNVNYAALHGANRRFIDGELPHLKRLLVGPEEAARHGRTVVVGHRSEPYRKVLARLQADQHVFDLSGIDDLQPEATYEGVYW